MLRKLIDYLTIRRSRYFDPVYYLRNYPDCRLADVDPLWHFVERGWCDGRNPSSNFDTGYYLRANPDVRHSGINPLMHYIKHGQKEGRAPNPLQDFQKSAKPRMNRLGGLRNAIYNLGGRLFWRIPYKSRLRLLYWTYQNIGFMFAGMPHYENWRNSGSSTLIHIQSYLIDIHPIQSELDEKGKIAIHIHIFYADLVKEFVKYLKNMPFSYDLYVSVATEEAMDSCQRSYVGLPLCNQVIIEPVDNRGRDIAPMFCAFGGKLADYDYIAHIHSKKSLYNKGGTLGWREYLCENLLGSPDRIKQILNLMQGDEPCGIVYPQNYVLLPYWANTWLGNRGPGHVWCARLGINYLPRGYFDYPAGSMFWARGDALAPLFQADIALDDFPEESGQNDGTLAHVMERLFVLCSLKQGMPPGIIKDDGNPSWSSWRFDQYTSRVTQHLTEMLKSPNSVLIAFDIFESLLCRPLLDPETIKDIVLRRIEEECRLPYKEYRVIAEQQAREAKGRDVGLDDIYIRLGELTGFFETTLAEIRTIEEEVEKASLEPRREALSLYQNALATGKPVVIISDMFLPRSTIESILRQWEITNWEALFLSNEIGYRKDNGKLYDYVLTEYETDSRQLLMIGDNERSDVQIPTDKEMSVIHLLRPVELARGLPRFTNLITSHENKQDVDAEISLGLVVRKNFAPIQFPNLDPKSLVEVTPFNLGYSLIGPLLVSFAQWLLKRANEDGIDRFYFLSREGKPIKAIFEK